MRTPLLAILAVLAAVAPASASTVLEYQGNGKLATREEPALPPPLGPELAVPGGEQDCPLPDAAAKPQARAAASSVTRAISRARSRGTISAAAAKRYRSSYSKAIRARNRAGGRNRRELGAVIGTLQSIAARGKLTGGGGAGALLPPRPHPPVLPGGPHLPPRPPPNPPPPPPPPPDHRGGP